MQTNSLELDAVGCESWSLCCHTLVNEQCPSEVTQVCQITLTKPRSYVQQYCLADNDSGSWDRSTFASTDRWRVNSYSNTHLAIQVAQTDMRWEIITIMMTIIVIIDTHRALPHISVTPHLCIIF